MNDKAILFKFFWIFSLIFTFESKAQTFQLVADKHFSVEVPNYLKADFELNNEASMQLSNSQKEIYLIIIEDEKSELNNENQSLEFYQNFMVQNLTSLGALEEIKVSQPDFKRINGLKAIEATINAVFDDEFDVWYKVVVFESKLRFYQLIVWTLKRQKVLYGDDIDRIVKSFKEL